MTIPLLAMLFALILIIVSIVWLYLRIRKTEKLSQETALLLQGFIALATAPPPEPVIEPKEKRSDNNSVIDIQELYKQKKGK